MASGAAQDEGRASYSGRGDALQNPPVLAGIGNPASHLLWQHHAVNDVDHTVAADDVCLHNLGIVHP